MKARVRIFKSDGITFQGYPVKLSVTHKGRTSRKVIGYSTEEYWNPIREIPLPVHPDYETLYGLILNIRKISITQEFRSCTSIVRAFELLGHKDKPANDPLVSEYFRVYILKLRSQGRDGYADLFESVSKQLKAYKPFLSVSDLTSEFLQEWKKHRLGFNSDKTVKTYLEILRALYNEAVDDPNVSIVDARPFTRVMKGLRVKRRRVKNRYIDRQTMKSLYPVAVAGGFGLTGAQLRALRFGMLQFFLCGADLIDLYFLEKRKFFRDRVMLTRRKLGKYEEEYDVRVFPEAKVLIELLSNNISGNYIFPGEKTHNRYKMFRRNHNRDLRVVQQKLGVKLLPIDQNLNSKTFRHTFSTLAKFQYVDPDVKRELMGHERSDISTVYEDRFPENVRDAAHGKVVDLTIDDIHNY